ncbi:hypothetical protein PHMEG_00024826 [Phytophthora megakarya]|uniref:Uncharacterized protein n=1 Tax=Phytophthora megakarya TaxID=4795 RepID=A0A225VDH0_9STRA|nr:hypothetical protein PHMEG_00024826 [Phytophthora megakarya]
MTVRPRCSNSNKKCVCRRMNIGRISRNRATTVDLTGSGAASLTHLMERFRSTCCSFNCGRPAEEPPAVTVAAGINLPVPPRYRGSSKKENQVFMDSYAIYTKHTKALNQGIQVIFFVMPLSACIEQDTVVKNCGFELFKDEKDATESE